MGSLGTWFSGGIGSARLMVGPNDPEVLLQPKRLYDSMILCMAVKCHMNSQLLFRKGKSPQVSQIWFTIF